MSTWSSYSESFYHFILESQLNQRFNKRRDGLTLNNVIDTSCSNISLHRESPKSSNQIKDYYFYIPDSLNSTKDLDKINQNSECKIPTSTVIHKSPGNHTSRRINNLLYSSGNIKNSVYTIPYELSQYTLSNVSLYSDNAVSKTNLFNELQREIINSTDSVYLYDNNCTNNLKHVVIKPSGVLNSGIMGLEINVKPMDDNLIISTNELLTIYPSCFFYYEKKNSNYFMDPYDNINSNKSHKVECTWDGYSLRSKIYNEKNKFISVHEDLDILEMKAENLSTYSTTIYARNPLGIFVFRYYFDEEWKIKPINNVSFTEDEKIYYMCLSPYIPNDAVFLKTTNEMLIYDGYKGHERDTISLSSLINPNKDIIQTISYGMDNNSLILGGNKLYHYDRRSNNMNDLILPLQSSITVTRVKWTERKYDYDYPSHHYKHLLSGRNCSFSSYFRKSNPSFWSSFTACEVHPVFNYILAVVCGTSDCFLLFDLRIPNSPLIDIPLPSSKFLGSRFRSLKWYFVDGVSYLFAFSWRNKLPIVSRFIIDSSFHSYSELENQKDSFKDFENLDRNYDTSILFDRSRILNFSNSGQFQEDANFPSFGTSIKNENYFDLPLQFTNENAMTDIFHGYLGLTHLHFKKQKIKLSLAYTTSGRLMCLDMDNRNIVLNNHTYNNNSNKENKEKDKDKDDNNEDNNKGKEENKGNSQIDLEDNTNSFIGFRITCGNSSGLNVPNDIKFDKEFKYINVKKSELDKQYTEFTAVNLNENFVKIQEQHFGDEKMYSSLSINDTYVNEENIQKFNSKEILKMILEFQKSDDDDNKGPVISKTRFDKLYCKENIKSYNSWNPLDTRFDKEFDEDRFENDQLNNNNNTNDTNNNNNENISNINIDFLEKLLHHSIDKNSTSDENVDKLNHDESLVFDKGIIETFGGMIMKNTNMNNNRECTETGETNVNEHTNNNRENIKNDQIQNIKHRNDCRINDLICVEVEKEPEDVEYHPLVEEIMSTWVVEKR